MTQSATELKDEWWFCVSQFPMQSLPSDDCVDDTSSCADGRSQPFPVREQDRGAPSKHDDGKHVESPDGDRLILMSGPQAPQVPFCSALESQNVSNLIQVMTSPLSTSVWVDPGAIFGSELVSTTAVAVDMWFAVTTCPTRKVTCPPATIWLPII